MKGLIKKNVENYIASNNGLLYAPMPHKYFSCYKSLFENRSEIVKNKLLELKETGLKLKTAIDIGSHWGEMCYLLEDLKIKVIAIEKYKKAYDILIELRNQYGSEFEAINCNVFELKKIDYDIVIAFNIFHHFIKTEENHENLKKLLNKLRSKVMFFQSHDKNETQMINSYKNYSHEEFVDFIKDNSCYDEHKKLQDSRRPIYVLYSK